MNKDLINKDKVADILFGLLEGRLEKEIIDGYSSPLRDIVSEVVKENAEKIRNVYREMLNDLLDEPMKLKQDIKEEFRRKVAKNLVGKLEGQVEGAVNVLQQDQTLKAKMIVVLEKFIKDNSELKSPTEA